MPSNLQHPTQPFRAELAPLGSDLIREDAAREFLRRLRETLTESSCVHLLCRFNGHSERYNRKKITGEKPISIDEATYLLRKLKDRRKDNSHACAYVLDPLLKACDLTVRSAILKNAPAEAMELTFAFASALDAYQDALDGGCTANEAKRLILANSKLLIEANDFATACEQITSDGGSR